MKSIDQVTFGLSGTAKAFGTSRGPPLAWLDPQVQLQGTVDPINPFVVLGGCPFTLRRCRKHSLKPHVLRAASQADQQVSDHFSLIAEQRAVAIALLAYAKRPAG